MPNKPDDDLVVVVLGMAFMIVGLFLLLGVTNISENFVQHGPALATSIFMAGLITITLDRISMRRISKGIHRQLSNGLNELQFHEFGFLDVTKTAVYDDIYDACRSSKVIQIVNTWSPNLDSILKAAEERILSKKCSVEIYLLDPDSEMAKQRSVSIKQPEDYVPGLIRNNKTEVTTFVQRLAEKVGPGVMEKQVRLYFYDTLPSCAIYRIDGRAWLSFYWQGIPSERTPNIVVDYTTGGPMQTRCEKQMVAIAKGVPYENLFADTTD